MSQSAKSQQSILESVNTKVLKSDLPSLSIGDTVNVHNRIVEGDKERVQIFQGVLIARAGRGMTDMITVRRVVDEVGIERVWPINSPLIAKIEVLRHGDARRSKLYYLRDRVGKSRRLRDRRRGLKNIEVPGEKKPAAAATATAEPAQQ
ncbi:MAG: 50S ribosomal protein L19 [Phycisphaeraceae bacterium]|nr:50S ribosomal protein L19 [Phycisphaeraceae bacterium]